jgi:D-arabinose 1-dehydrogenase-like Zn-dependent alcohol dehydrogenase
MAPPTSILMEIKAMGFEQIKGDAKLLLYTPKPLAKNDLDFVMMYNGICHLDIHMIDNDWGMTHLPLIPGHEVVGHVLAVGSAITDIAPEDVVGLGAQCQTCKECNYCKQGIDNVCADWVFTYMTTTKDELGEHIHHGGCKLLKHHDGLVNISSLTITHCI